jgi:hemoglobin-like flavoprotein
MNLPADFHEKCTSVFYEELFNLIPAARELFSGLTQKHSIFSIAMLAILGDAKDPDALRQQLRQLGKRHHAFGILPLHIKVGRQAFSTAVQKAAPDLTDGDLAFFETAYDELAAAMIDRPQPA